jgi:glutathione synthetase
MNQSASKTEFAKSIAAEAIEFAVSQGVVRYTKDGGVSHLPFSLAPWPCSHAFYDRGRLATQVYSRMYHQVATQLPFLEESLAKLREADDFVEGLFSCVSARTWEKPWIYLSRNDFMPSGSGADCWPKQIEMNLMAASLGCASEKVHQILCNLYPPEVRAKMPPNPAGSGLAAYLAKAFRQVCSPDAQILFIVPEGEVNAFDQRMLQNYLQFNHSISVRRTTLAEVEEKLEERNGVAYFENREVGIAYFRAGYSPTHYHQKAWSARRRLENSSAICIPNAPTQLANTKKMQQLLSRRDVLSAFVSPAETDFLLNTQVVMSGVDETVEFRGQNAVARELALSAPELWVLKPSREGGGNNFFGDDLVKKLNEMSPVEAQGYILMEAIIQPTQVGVRAIDGRVEESACVTELGHFIGSLYRPGIMEPESVELFGYLQRTKDVANKEGLVLGGFSFLDSVVLE